MGKLEKGMIQVYTGDGKGKTTAALGLGLRACGHGFSVFMVQFMKGKVFYGELETVRKVPGFTIQQFGRPDFVNKEDPARVDIEKAQEALDFAKDLVAKGDHDIIILDEINVALDFNLIQVGEVVELLRTKPEHVEIVLTGRNAPEEIMEMADLVSHVKEVKHPFMKGVPARTGIEH